MRTILPQTLDPVWAFQARTAIGMAATVKMQINQGLPSFAVTGFETFGNPDAYTPELKHDQTFTYNANLTYSRGKHTLRFGTQLVNNRLNEYQPQRGFGPRGSFTFTGGVTALRGGASSNFANAFAQFLLGAPDSLGKATSISTRSPASNGNRASTPRISGRHPTS